MNRTPAHWTLHVLSGRQTGVQTPLTEGRHLVGNDESCSDLVVELGADGARHLAMLRVDGQALTLIAMAGTVRVDDRALLPQQAHALQAGQHFNVGEVTLALTEPGTTINAAAARRSASTSRADTAAGRAPRAAHAIRAVLVLAVALAAGSALMWGSGQVQARLSTPAIDSERAGERLSSLVKALNLPELRVQADSSDPHPRVEGYVPDGPTYARLEAELARDGQGAVMRVHTVQPMEDSLRQRLREHQPQLQVSYVGAGVFETRIASERFGVLRAAGERAMKDLPGVQALRFNFTDLHLAESGQSAHATLSRSQQRLGEFVVTGDGMPLPAEGTALPRFVEIRWGELPSVITRQGERFFAGSRLADGSQISRIEPRAVVLLRGGVERLEVVQPTPVGAAVAAQADEAAASPEAPLAAPIRASPASTNEAHGITHTSALQTLRP